jgi:DNA-binding beta-propeller fold protein YncE
MPRRTRRTPAATLRLLFVTLLALCASQFVAIATADAPVGSLMALSCVGNTGNGPAGCVGADGLEGADSLAVSPDGKNVYVASFKSNALDVFERLAGGSLKPMGCIGSTGAGPPSCTSAPGLVGATSVAVSPDGKNVYATGAKSDSLDVFERLPGGGLKPMGCVADNEEGPAPCGFVEHFIEPRSVTVSPDGQFVYVVTTETSRLFTFERLPGGALKEIDCVAGGGIVCTRAVGLEDPAGLGVSPDGQNVYVTATHSNTLTLLERTPSGKLKWMGCFADPETTEEARTACVSVPGLKRPLSATVSPDGKTVYVTSFLSKAVLLFERQAGGFLKSAGCVDDTSAGASGCAFHTDGLDGPTSIAISPDGANAYVTSINSKALALFERFAGGALKPMGCIGNSGNGPASCIGTNGLEGADSVRVSPDGKNVYVASSESRAVLAFARAGAPNEEGAPGGNGGGGGNGAGGGNSGGGSKPVTSTFGNLRLSLSIAGSAACLTKPGPLDAKLSSSKVTSTGPALHLVHALVFVDRGIKHVHRRHAIRHGHRVTLTTVSYSPNHTVSGLPASLAFPLGSLHSGTHTLRVKYVFHEKVRRHGKLVTVTVTKTQSSRFLVC